MQNIGLIEANYPRLNPCSIPRGRLAQTLLECRRNRAKPEARSLPGCTRNASGSVVAGKLQNGTAVSVKFLLHVSYSGAKLSARAACSAVMSGKPTQLASSVPVQ